MELDCIFPNGCSLQNSSNRGHTPLEVGLCRHGEGCRGGDESVGAVVTCRDPHPHNSHHCNHEKGGGGGGGGGEAVALGDAEDEDGHVCDGDPSGDGGDGVLCGMELELEAKGVAMVGEYDELGPRKNKIYCLNGDLE